MADTKSHLVSGRSDRLSFISWRDISTGPMTVLEVVWTDPRTEQRRLSIVEFEFGCQPNVLVGPELDEITTLIVAMDIRREQRGVACLHRDADGPSDDLKATLVAAQKQVA